MEIEKFIGYSEAELKEENGLGGMGGFFKHGMRWKDYLEVFNENVHADLEKLRKAIIEKNIRCTGEQHQSDFYKSVPLWDNGLVDTYSYRAWGDLMAAIWSEVDNTDYSYMSFYM